MQGADLAAQRGQNRLRGTDTDYGRRRLSGSGAHLQSRAGVRAGTSAEQMQNLISFFMNALGGAAGQAQFSQGLGMQGLTQTQMPVKGSSKAGYLGLLQSPQISV